MRGLVGFLTPFIGLINVYSVRFCDMSVRVVFVVYDLVKFGYG